ncbi:MAG: 23S rRNA (uracil(1939)-C(5))-methyltransferase RlmD, partial [Clostridiales bacterium]|nr:23S rRNA (uracil(1939)-C(5))-methyltransferase RlmD [Clostridiales bacterium]
MIKRGDTLTLDVTGTNIFARGVARADGMVVFCRGALAGDTVRACVTDVKKNYAEADCVKIEKPSPHRVTPACPHADECGGCVFSHVTREHEADVKRRAVADAFRREGIRISEDAVAFADTCGEGYRNKAVFHFDADGNIGFFADGTRDFVKIERCLSVSPAINDTAHKAEAILKEDGVLPRELTYLYIRYMKETDEASLALGYTGSASLDSFARKITDADCRVVGVARGRAASPESRDERFEKLSGRDFVSAAVGGISFDVPPASFFQVNLEGAEALIRAVTEYAAPKNGERIADIYCGAGLFALSLAKRAPGAEVYGIELNRDAVRAANETASKNGIKNAFFVAGDSSELKSKTGVDRFDTAVVDPP